MTRCWVTGVAWSWLWVSSNQIGPIPTPRTTYMTRTQISSTPTNKQTKTLSTSSQLQPNWTNSNTPHNLHIYSWRGHRYPIYHISYILYDKAGAEISSLIAINKQKPHWRYFKSASTKLDPCPPTTMSKLGRWLWVKHQIGPISSPYVLLNDPLTILFQNKLHSFWNAN